MRKLKESGLPIDKITITDHGTPDYFRVGEHNAWDDDETWKLIEELLDLLNKDGELTLAVCYGLAREDVRDRLKKLLKDKKKNQSVRGTDTTCWMPSTIPNPGKPNFYPADTIPGERGVGKPGPVKPWITIVPEPTIAPVDPSRMLPSCPGLIQ